VSAHQYIERIKKRPSFPVSTQTFVLLRPHNIKVTYFCPKHLIVLYLGLAIKIYALSVSPVSWWYFLAEPRHVVLHSLYRYVTSESVVIKWSSSRI